MRIRSIKEYVARKTLKTRHKLVKRLSPNIGYSIEQFQKMNNYIAKTPRPMVLAAKKHFPEGKPVDAVEIGVEKADNSLSILRELPIQRLFLIDPYIAYEDASGHADYSAACEIAHAKLSGYPQVIWLQKTSEFAIRELQNDASIDFLYIDGNHSYESVKKDITLYYPIMKNNGLIGGHDYTPYYETVMKAVNEFAEEANLDLHAIFPDWWFVVKR